MVANIRRVRALRTILRETAPDVVVSFLNYTNILTLLASKGLGCPVLVSERLDPRVHELSPLWNAMRRLLYPQARVLINQTEAAASWFRPWMKGRVVIIPNPVSEPDLAGPPALELPPGSVVAMGRLHHQKGFDTLLRATALLRERHPSIRLTILGEGPLRAELEKLREELELDDVVDMPGKIQNPATVLAQAEVFVLSSVTEGFPNVLCEAMAVGLPVVSTRCPSGPEEIVTDGREGRLVPVGDTESLAGALAEILADPESRRVMGEAAREVIDRFSLEVVLGKWDAVFKMIELGTEGLN